MSQRRREQTLADYVVIALSPALIMLLVGSLVYFLQDLLYRGEHPGRLMWVLGLFVFGQVLVARIGIEEGVAHSQLFGLALLGAAGLFCLRFIPLFIPAMLLLALVAWCSWRLTRDCTFIDDSVDASGEGLLQATLQPASEPTAGPSATPQPTATATPRVAPSSPPATSAPESSSPPRFEDPRQVFSLAERLALANERRRPASAQESTRQRDRDNREPVLASGRPQGTSKPGSWVVYFSLAALPLFGLGQLLIPASDLVRRRYSFQLLVVYVAAALGLLLTTSFLGLRRYLRQRNLQMPAQITVRWLVWGGLLGLLVLGVAVLVPRPQGEYSLTHWVDQIDQRVAASRWAVIPGGAGEGAGRVMQAAPPRQPGGGEVPQGPGGIPNPQAQMAGADGAQAAAQPNPAANPQAAGAAEPNAPQGKTGAEGQGKGQGEGQGQQPQPGGQGGENGQGRGTGQGQAQGEGQGQGNQPGGTSGRAPQPPPSGSPRDGNSKPDTNRPNNPDSPEGHPASPKDQPGQQPPSDGNPQDPAAGAPPQDQRAPAAQNQPAPRQPSRPPNAQPQPAPAAGRPGAAGNPPPDAQRPQAGNPQPAAQPPVAPPAPPQPPATPGFLTQLLQSMSQFGGWFKWLFYGLLALGGVWLLIRHGGALWDLFQDLFGWKRSGADAKPAAAPAAPPAPPRPFADYANPFATGQARRMPLKELAGYSFEALEAWARDSRQPRGAEQTPSEFAQQLARRQPQWKSEVTDAADVYVQVAYAGRDPAAGPEVFERLWRRLDESGR